MKRKNVAIIGSTGSIGINTLKVIDQFPEQFQVVALSAYNNCDLLIRQIKKYRPRYAAVSQQQYEKIKSRVDAKRCTVCLADQDLAMIATLPQVDVVILAMRGSAALAPFMAAVKAGKTVAPANKEALVVAGDLLIAEARRTGATIVPIDSEQSAIFQCLQGQNRGELKRVLLTASGGTLLRVSSSKFDRLTVEEILSHPRWKMGAKITVDSATLMNKGFEVIEAQKLFGLKANEIRVVVHPQAIIHSMVEFIDGSVLAQLASTDMRLPIQYALTYPQRNSVRLPALDLCAIQSLTFEEPDLKRFPLLALALEVAKKDGSLPAVLNAADEVAVEAFLNRKIKLTKIFDVVSKVVKKHRLVLKPNLQEVLEADQWAREETRKLI
ncbi:MAG: 1-deoxy-D-xylulose-5-phosphate reductoisomerase [Candidatus Omnitrophica bacterium]|nr:1-deoxy-D-xylulose-5-phosphate reductoisomerase [Candidatus Omnitrophota bacterium]